MEGCRQRSIFWTQRALGAPTAASVSNIMQRQRCPVRRPPLDRFLANRGSVLRNIGLAILGLIVIFSCDSFNAALTGGGTADPGFQGTDTRMQIITIVLWTLLIGLSFIPGMICYPQRRTGLLWPALFLAWSVFSSVWSDDPMSSMPKAAVLLALSLATWRLAAMIAVDEMFTCVYYALSVLLIASLALVILVPSVGVVQEEWQHVGNWNGMFASKQGLGMISAFALGISLLRVISPRRSLLDMLMTVVAGVCLFGSASRGGGAIAIVATTCMVLARRRPKLLATLVSGILIADLFMAAANITYFMITGAPHYELFGEPINFTERTFIWQYALGLLREQPFIGYGLNGFWTDANTFYGYKRLHGWVLDNYHDGYIAIIVETGIVGFLLFSTAATQFISRLRTRIMQTPGDRLSLEMVVGYMLMFFTINLSEGLLLRSTNFLVVLFNFLVVKVMSSPVPHALRHRVVPSRRQPVEPRVAGRQQGHVTASPE